MCHLLRELTSHKVNDLNEAIKIEVLDEPGSGGACHKYQITVGDTGLVTTICFQNGPIKEAGFNGVTQEALLAIIEDRLAGFQSGPYSTTENGCALADVRSAMEWLHKRTKDRLARGVEGTHQV